MRQCQRSRLAALTGRVDSCAAVFVGLRQKQAQKVQTPHTGVPAALPRRPTSYAESLLIAPSQPGIWSSGSQAMCPSPWRSMFDGPCPSIAACFGSLSNRLYVSAAFVCLLKSLLRPSFLVTAIGRTSRHVAMTGRSCLAPNPP